MPDKASPSEIRVVHTIPTSEPNVWLGLPNIRLSMSMRLTPFYPVHSCLVMSDLPIALKWEPGLIGMSIALALYGVLVCQYLFYILAFPRDRRLIKCAVFLVFILDTVNTLTSLSFHCRTLILCRWKTTNACSFQLTWDLSATLVSGLFVSFFVQCFYAHRVWIICGLSKPLTGIVLFVALAALGEFCPQSHSLSLIRSAFGMCMSLMAVLRNLLTKPFLNCQVTLGDMYSTNDIGTMFNNPYSAVNALASAICDGIITTSIYICLRRPYGGLLRKENCITQFNIVFVRMGTINFVSALAMAILSFRDQSVGKYLPAAPGFLLSKAYSNSMLAV
ncbi:hypothetical protein EDC04DRAFT_92456 [Pisolithus marmoratus]|nr:hypothetical protein EDC04DRAFT_92456 [Pisolithus marmoratus]